MTRETPEEFREKQKGPVIAMTTHFHDDLSVDLDAMRRLTEYYLEEGAPTISATGSTGEYGALTDEERKAVQKTVIDTAEGSCMTAIAGVSDMASLIECTPEERDQLRSVCIEASLLDELVTVAAG